MCGFLYFIATTQKKKKEKIQKKVENESAKEFYGEAKEQNLIEV